MSGNTRYAPMPTTKSPTNITGKATIERIMPKIFNSPHVAITANFTKFHKTQTANNPKIISSIFPLLKYKPFCYTRKAACSHILYTWKYLFSIGIHVFSKRAAISAPFRTIIRLICSSASTTENTLISPYCPKYG